MKDVHLQSSVLLMTQKNTCKVKKNTKPIIDIDLPFLLRNKLNDKIQLKKYVVKKIINLQYLKNLI